MLRNLLVLEAKAVVYRGRRMSRAQRREAAADGAYYSAFRPHPGERVSKRAVREAFLTGRRGVVGVGDPAARTPSKAQAAIGRRLKKAGSGVNKAAGARMRQIAKRRRGRDDKLMLRGGSLYRVANPNPFRASLRGSNADLAEAARMGKGRRRRRKV